MVRYSLRFEFEVMEGAFGLVAGSWPRGFLHGMTVGELNPPVSFSKCLISAMY
jgi:hypothetical protein